MSQDDPVRHIVRNNQNQPVELHLPSGVLVLLPRETAELSEDDLAAPQLRALQRGRRITLQRSTEPAPVTGPPSTPEASPEHGADTARTSSAQLLGHGAATPPEAGASDGIQYRAEHR